MKKFENKTVMVTGAGANIGKEIAISFARQGANVIVCDYKRENAEQTAKEIELLGVKTLVAVCDVRDRESVFDYANQAIEKFGKIDILVNNAGGSAWLLGKLSKFVDAEKETLDFVLDTNIKGAMNCAQAVLKSMIKNEYGRIINIASIAGITGLADRVDYSAAKAALIGMVKALAMEVGEYNVLVNSVSPGAIERGGVKREHMTYIGKNGRSGTPKNIADAVLFLAESDFITGTNVVVDGGRTLGVSYL